VFEIYFCILPLHHNISEIASVFILRKHRSEGFCSGNGTDWTKTGSFDLHLFHLKTKPGHFIMFRSFQRKGVRGGRGEG